MAGLLGNSWDDPKSMAVMQLAAGLLGGGNFGQALGRGLGGYQQTMSAAKEQALLDEQMQWKRDERKQKEDQRKQESEIERLIQAQFMPTTGIQAIQGDALGPTVAKAQNIGQTRPIDYQALSAQRVPFERLKQLADAANLGRAEVARTLETDGPDGSKLIRQLDRWGKDVVPGMPGYVAPVQVNQGDKISFAKPQAGQTFNVGMSPAEQQRVAQGWASNSLARERFNFDKQQQTAGPKPVFNADAGGFIYPPSPTNPQGGIVPLQGFQKPLNDVQSKAQLFGTRMQEADKVLSSLAEEGKNFSTFGANAPFIGGVVNSLNTEKGQMLDQAKRDFTNAVLRRESGAAIGQDEFDNANKQYFPQLGDSPGVIAQKAKNRQLAVNGILAEVPVGAKPITVPDKPSPSGKPPPMLGQVVNGWKFKGGSPADRSNWEKQ